MKIPSLISWAFVVLLSAGQVCAQGTIDDGPFPDDLNGSNFTYPWPVKLYNFTSQHEQLSMAFMDVQPTTYPNGKTAILLHGKYFCGPTWEATARQLIAVGYRVILPDQIGFCKSTKTATYQFSLQQFSLNTNGLLQALGIGNVTVIGHSMGGMTAARYSLMYADSVTELVMVNPLGLEDWKAKGVPYQSIDLSDITEAASNYTSIRNYEQSTYYVGTWNASYDVWVYMEVNIYQGSEAATYAFGQAKVTDMILTEPVIYEFPLLKPKTLLIIGDKDTTAIGAAWSPPAVKAVIGNYSVLGKQAAAMIPNASLIEFADLGHAPHIQDPDGFYAALLGWLSSE
jgi:pimeloyl-ACP methyl ester carboxylesterase